MSQDTDRLERKVEEDREEIGRIIDEIQDRLSLGKLVDQASGYMKSGGVNLAQSVRDNPLPVILTGIGLSWLMASSHSSSERDVNSDSEITGVMNEHRALHEALTRARTDASAIKRKKGENESTFQERVAEAKAKALSLKRDAGETAEAFRQRVDEALSQAESKASDLLERTKDAGKNVADAIASQTQTVGRKARNVGSSVSNFYQEQPLVAAALGVATGAILSALVPPTRTEQRALDKYGKGIKEQTKRAASGTAERAKKAAAEGVSRVAEVADEEFRGRSQASQ